MELVISRYVWEKIRHLKEYKSCEVGFWGIASDPEKPLVITDALISKQKCSPVSVDWDDEGLADFQFQQRKLGLQPKQYFRVWIHTHPKMTPTPSSTDEGTLKNVFSDCDWCVMFILGDDDEIYCRYRDNKNNTSKEIPTVVDLDLENKTSTKKLWEEEYDANVKYDEWVSQYRGPITSGKSSNPYGKYSEAYGGVYGDYDEYYEWKYGSPTNQAGNNSGHSKRYSPESKRIYPPTQD